METIGKRIQRLRKARGITRQGDLAEAIGVDQSTVSDIESKNRKFYAETLLRMSELFQVSPWTIMHGGEEQDMGSIELQRIYQSLSPDQRETLIRMATALLPPKANSKAA